MLPLCNGQPSTACWVYHRQMDADNAVRAVRDQRITPTLLGNSRRGKRTSSSCLLSHLVGSIKKKVTNLNFFLFYLTFEGEIFRSIMQHLVGWQMTGSETTCCFDMSSHSFICSRIAFCRMASIYKRLRHFRVI